MAKPKEVTIKVKGSSWKVEILSDKDFDQKHGKGHRKSAAVTSSARVISFRKGELTFISVIHELVHAFVFESHTETMIDVTPDDREELCASIISKNFFILGSLASETIQSLS